MHRAPRVAYLSPSMAGGQFDSRTWRMAGSAAASGYEVVIYARWFDGLAFEDHLAGHRVVRVPIERTMAIPGLRWFGRRRLARLRSRERQHQQAADTASRQRPGADATPRAPVSDDRRAYRAHPLLRLGRAAFLRLLSLLPRWTHAPIMWAAWRAALRDVAEPAEIWHGMWMASLPAVVALRDSIGGAAIYDSRDIFFESRDWPRVGRLPRAWLLRLERRLAASCDATLTVNDAYADILAEKLRIPRPAIVMNCPEKFTPSSPPPNLIRELLGLSDDTAVVLYQGGLFTERGIEESMDAILRVEGACLVLMGYGNLRDELTRAVARDPYRGRVFVIDPVPPADLLSWTASADVMLMAIAPTTLNHRYTTPQKLFEAMAAGVPVVATDLPGMAEIVHATGCGVLCETVAPEPIAAAIRSILERSPEERSAQRARCLEAAHTRYNWESQEATLLQLYERLARGQRATAAGDPSAA